MQTTRLKTWAESFFRKQLLAITILGLAAPSASYGSGVVSTPTLAAFNSALSGGGAVTFACDGTITVTSPENISANTTIDATGHNIVISGGTSSQIFRVSSGVNLALTTLIITGGYNTNGGAIYNQGNLAATNCAFIGNYAIGIPGTNAVNAGASGQSGSGVRGGAIYNLGTLSLYGCQFQLNYAVGGAGGYGQTGATVGSGVGGNGGAGGAGGLAYGGAIFSSNSVSISDCSFIDNGVEGGNGGAGGYGFSWQADGNLTSASDSTGSGAYSYDTAGLLTNRLVGNRMTGITSRDGEGRPLSIATTVNMLSQLNESLTWSGDGLLATHTLARADFTDPHVYTYANLSRRLVQEQLNLNGSTSWTNTLVYDKGVSGGPGVLTQMGQTSGASNKWSGVTDAFSRVATETNNTFQFPAYGHVNGQSILLSAWLDNQPVSISAVGTSAMQWRAMMDLSPGTHQLKVAAAHPSGFFTAWATNSFTNSVAYQATADSYDSAGNITNRVWKSPNGTVDRTQILSWDARGRLHSVTERDASNSGYNWSAVYDPLNRRLQTTTVLVTNGVASTAPPQTINSYFDPQVEFLELGVAYNNQTVWKLYGPDLNGKYGGLNGTGGFDAVSPYLNLFNPVIRDFRGNILAEVTNGVVSWFPSRPTGYGAVPGYRPLALGNGVDICLSSAWRGHWVDITGYHQIGMRPYDPISGRWLTYDSVWNERDPNYYTFCGGEPIMRFDRDGRCSNPSQQNGVTAASVFGSNSGNVNANSLLTWGMQNPNAQITGNDNASGWMQVGQAMANGTLSNPQYVNGYTDQFGRNYMDFCYSCHDPNDPVAQLKLGAAFNTVNTSIPAFLAQNALAFVPGEGIVGDAAMAGSVINSTAQTTFYVAADGTVIPANIYRVFGGNARGMGDFWTTVNPATVPNFRAAAGLPPGNAGTWVAEGQMTSIQGVTYDATAVPGPATQAGQAMVPQIQFQPGTASSQVNVNAVYNVQSPY